MLTRRTFVAMLTATLLTQLAVAPAAAAKPTRPPAPGPGDERPLTAQELAASERRIAAAEAHAAETASSGDDLVSLACVTPQSTTPTSTVQACAVPQGFLSVEARDQTLSHYCGPAVGQVIANYSWAMSTGGNKYTQGRI